MASHLRSTVRLFLFVAANVWLCWVPSEADGLPRFVLPMKAEKSLSFLVVGDWGRKGLYNQSEVAIQMGVAGEKLDIDFVISTGDNFYEDGLKGVCDPAFNESFINIYNTPSLQTPWYNGDVEAQLSPILKEMDRRWHCMRSFMLITGFVHFFFVDTTPFVDEYFTNPKDHTYDWKGVLPRDVYLAELLKNVDLELKKSTAKWKIVVGHHTIKSAGHHGVTEELEKQLLPILQVVPDMLLLVLEVITDAFLVKSPCILQANNVDMYINGHDHCLEHIISSQIQFLTSGGGSKAWRGDIKGWSAEELKLYYDGQGFMSLQMTDTNAHIVFYDVYGNVLHEWSISNHLDAAA
ncbi:Purple acid phosphatase 3 [Morella rubra]|uniref:Purple acid phosphatase n=1 Tax=Morella rubra TaxID=262757 RepID=A0A6A1V103_9ROSI|nr:Purple acid phosphatase 3 [Morella rubra]